MTGESLPVLKQPSSSVFSGGVVLDGTIVVRTTAAAEDSTASRIAAVTAAALKQRASVETWLTQLTNHWSKAVVFGTSAAFAVLLACGVPLWGSRGAAYRALAVLTAGAPCALLLVPLAFVCAVAVLSRHGIIVKGSQLFDALTKVSFVALDKTGTVSQGQLSCVSIQEVCGLHATKQAAEPLVAAAALSLRGRHPVCSAVLEQLAHARAQPVKSVWEQYVGSNMRPGAAVPEVTGFVAQAGAGMSGVVGSTAAAFGSAEYVRAMLSAEQRTALSGAIRKVGSNTVNSVLVQGPAAAAGKANATASAQRVTLFVFADVPKEDSKSAISALRRDGFGLGVYTGDNSSSALDMASRIDVPAADVHASLSPQDKARHVVELQQAGQRVLMVGDGINDAPALAQADVSVAMAEDMESATAGVANVVLLQGQARDGPLHVAGASIRKILFLLRTARAVRTVIIQNLVIAFCSMLAAVLPALGGFVPLWVAVLVHEGSTVAVALNSCRLLLLRQPLLDREEERLGTV